MSIGVSSDFLHVVNKTKIDTMDKIKRDTINLFFYSYKVKVCNFGGFQKKKRDVNK